MNKTRALKFSYNWNNKLHCKCFTTIRLSGKWQKGEIVNVFLKDGSNWIDKGKGQIIDIKSFQTSSINEYVARLDTGYSAAECKKIIQSMYKKPDPKIDLILVRYL